MEADSDYRNLDEFVWNVYTEMLEVVDSELEREGFQTRFPSYERRKLLGTKEGIYTEDWPFLNAFLDTDEFSDEGTMVHEIAHMVVDQTVRRYFPNLVGPYETDITKQLVFSSESRDTYQFDVEKAGQQLEMLYLGESDYLEDIGLKQYLRDEAELINEVEKARIPEIFKN